ncbi:hypothetical protein CONLIGDRAFT_570038, partial [Coniochaeta ligniaria NRRL 30616]
TPTPLPIIFATISFNWTDKLRLVQSPPSITRPHRGHRSAPPGRAASRPRSRFYAGHAYRVQAEGHAVSRRGAGEAVAGRRLVSATWLGFLYARGWVLVAPVSHSRHAESKDSLVFRQRRTMVGDVVVPPPVEWLVIAPTGGDRLRVISDGPTLSAASSGLAPSCRERNHDEMGLLVQALKQALTAIDYFQSGEWNHDSFEFKLKGYPWSATGQKTVKVQRLLLAVVETLDRFGWRSYATVRQRSGSDDDRKADTWYFVREEGWVLGSPFNRESSAFEGGPRQ